MNKILYLLTLVCLFCVNSLSAQTILGGEYFFDTDPGIGKAMSFTVIPGENVDKTLNISTKDMDEGFHTLYLRTYDDKGNWSLTEARPFFFYKKDEEKIDAFEYFLDQDPGVGNGIMEMLDEPTTAFELQNHPIDFIPLDKQTPKHILNIRTHDAETGEWSLGAAVAFAAAGANIDVQATGVAVPDPICPFGNTPQTITLCFENTGFQPIAAGAACATVTITGANPATFSGPSLCNASIIAPGQKSFVSIPNVLLPNTGANVVTATITLAGDENLSNNTNTVFLLSTDGMQVSATTVNVSCFGGNNGSITQTVTAGLWTGVGPYTYKWSDSNTITTKDRTNLTAGTYAVTITDAAGCKVNRSYLITQPVVLTATAVVSSTTATTATITVNAAGGTPPYTPAMPNVNTVTANGTY
ncbi:MAG: hypothetical protein RLZZ292_532, partial [Bacteroidota bacterium]